MPLFCALECVAQLREECFCFVFCFVKWAKIEIFMSETRGIPHCVSYDKDKLILHLKIMLPLGNNAFHMFAVCVVHLEKLGPPSTISTTTV